MLEQAKQRASKIEEDGKSAAFSELEKVREQIKIEKERHTAEAEREIERSKFEAEKIILEAEKKSL
jgi:F0F1-type ATP synthase membrane subunit b/b'